MFHFVVKNSDTSQTILNEYNNNYLSLDIEFENRKIWIIVSPIIEMEKINLKIYKSNKQILDNTANLISDLNQNIAFLEFKDSKLNQRFEIIVTKTKINTNLKESISIIDNRKEIKKVGSSYKELSNPKISQSRQVNSSQLREEVNLSQPKQVNLSQPKQVNLSQPKQVNLSQPKQVNLSQPKEDIDEIIIPSKEIKEEEQEEEEEEEYVCVPIKKKVISRTTTIKENLDKNKGTETVIEEEFEPNKSISFKIKK